ncbi:MAG: excisionase family DNA-binding protein [Rubrivivax sp.]|jgi:excisionase family DNA binding protein|nr:excisionase family DNA-binding protein [Rubrivivax sp.]
MNTPRSAVDPSEDCTTIEVAKRLGLAVRSVQLMVDRGELEAWKTPGGHRRIRRESVDRWLAERHAAAAHGQKERPPNAPQAAPSRAVARAPRVLLIEDSRHFQNLVSLLLKSRFPQVELHLADDGIAGLGLAGKLEPEVLLVDILLPGIDGATLIMSLRSHPAFARSRLIVVTSLEGAALDPYAFALEGLPVVHKPRLAVDLPALLASALAGNAEAADRTP